MTHAPLWPTNTALSLMSCEEQAELQSILQGSEWVIRPVESLNETTRALVQCPSPLVMCETRFCDGDWRDLLVRLNSLENTPNLVLLAHHDVALSAEFVNLGGYDVLEKPIDRFECLYVFASASRNWNARMPCALMPLCGRLPDAPEPFRKPLLAGPCAPDWPTGPGSFACTLNRDNDCEWATAR
jgi:hypothetical protein